MEAPSRRTATDNDIFDNIFFTSTVITYAKEGKKKGNDIKMTINGVFQ